MIKGSDWVGQYSRFSFDETKKYIMLLKEKGVPVLDDEFNVLQEIQMTILRRMVTAIVGDGAFGDGFLIVGTGAANNFDITAGKIVNDGWLTDLAADATYSAQPVSQPVLTTPSGGNRVDEVYLDMWAEEIDDLEDANIKDPSLGLRTSCRLQMKWAVKVAEGGTTPTNGLDGSNKYHWYYKLATLNRLNGNNTITSGMVADSRRKASDTHLTDEATATNYHIVVTNGIMTLKEE